MDNNSKICPSCKEEINKDAKKCPKCWTDLRNWFIKHYIISIILGLIIIWAIWSNWWNSNKTTTSLNTGTGTEIKTDKVEKAKLTKELCKSIKSWFTKEEVTKILWEPKSVSESSFEWLWTTEYLHFQEWFTMESCRVSLTNWKVTSISWTDL